MLHIIMLLFLRYEMDHFLRIRRHYLRMHNLQHRAILVEEIPRELRSRADLEFYFAALYPDKIKTVKIHLNMPETEKLIAQRDVVLNQQEHQGVRLEKARARNASEEAIEKLETTWRTLATAT